ATHEKLGNNSHVDELNAFYYVTNPACPEWRFANAYLGIALNAYTGEVMAFESAQQDKDFAINSFLVKII
ncbi:MAG: hypothetical protein RR379_12135, partial [Clostridia bacterium]